MTETRDSVVPANGGVVGGAVLGSWWRLDEGTGTTAADASGAGHTLTVTGTPRWTTRGPSTGGLSLDGASQWLSTSGPVLRTDTSLSIAAWVRLDAATMDGEADLPHGSFAITAVGQDGPSHSPFYLGARKVLDGQTTGAPDAPLRWDFTVAPIDGAVTGTIEWPHAAGAEVTLDEWVFLVGVYDLDAGTASLITPGSGQSVTQPLPDGWTRWHAEGGVQLGRSRYLDDNCDLWPGSVGAVRMFSGVLSADDARTLYQADTLATG